MADLAIETQGLTKHYGSVAALRGVDLAVRPGEIFGFLGPNGAGKTTTIRCLLDLIRPSGGRLRVLGLDPQAEPVAVRARTGYLPGELRLDDSLTVAGVLRYLAGLRGRSVAWDDVRQLAQRLDLPLDIRVKNLSKGNKQKVGLVQALMHRPALLLLDEPTSGLDPLVQQEVMRLLREAQASGATVFFSSHVLAEVESLAQRVGIIRQGRVVEVADTQQLVRRSLRRVRIRFRHAVVPDALTALPGVTLIARDDGQGLLLQVEGEMDALIKAAAEYPVSDLETHRPSLEEVFLAYYAPDPAEGS